MFEMESCGISTTCESHESGDTNRLFAVTIPSSANDDCHRDRANNGLNPVTVVAEPWEGQGGLMPWGGEGPGPGIVNACACPTKVLRWLCVWIQVPFFIITVLGM